MKKFEKILNIIELNEQVPAIVVDENYKIVVCNKLWKNEIGKAKQGKKFLKLFDNNTSLLIQNSFLDSKTFVKIQRRDIQVTVDENLKSYKLLISPFTIEEELFFYILLYKPNDESKTLIYPSLDDGSVSKKYDEIISELIIPQTDITTDESSFQFKLDIEKEPILIKNKQNILFVNNSYRKELSEDTTDLSNISIDDIIPGKILASYKQVEEEIYSLNLSFVIESSKYNPKDIHQVNRMIIYPVLGKNNEVDKIIIFGKIENFGNSKKSETGFHNESIQRKNSLNHLSEARIVYDKNTFDILDANYEAAKIYGFNDTNELKQINFTSLFPPEEMQLLLTPITQKSKLHLNQLKKNSEIISVDLERAHLVWNEKEACMVIISEHNDSDKEITNENKIVAGEKNNEENSINNATKIEDEKSIENEKNNNREIGKENMPVGSIKEMDKKSSFLSSLFHEILTPVNVILGFVQEIIDSIDKPTEEQQESAQIIKDNQQLLLQTMNTAVQYAQLEENKIKVKIDEFDINNSLVDLQDSLSRISEKENVKIIFDKMPESLLLKHDRNKLLAAISYFIKFVIKLTKESKIFISFAEIDNYLYILVKDNDNGISETVSKDMIEIYNSDALNDKKNFGISSITINLARKLNEILNARVLNYTDINNDDVIALLTPIVLTDKIRTEKESIKIEKEKPLEETLIEEIAAESEEINADKESEMPVVEEQIEDETKGIANHEVDDKIVESIHEEEEINTEEIATIEEVNKTAFDLSNLSCLFIDDNIDSHLLFKSQMKDFNLVKTAVNLTEALPLLTKYNFDVIFVDIHLNDKYNGMDVLKIVRQFNNYKNTPLIAVTAYPFEGDREQFLNFGFTDYLQKPLLRDKLLKLLKQNFS